MSREIDERIVQMQFDNARFEANARNTINTLNSLSEALQFKDASKGFYNVEDASRRINFEKLTSAIDLVNSRFSNTGIMAARMLETITDKAIQAGKAIFDAMFVTARKDGFHEYELLMDSTKQILNAAKREDGTAVSLEEVSSALEELNKYSDDTIYHFQDMTSNIGKFTNQGVSLDDSVAAIKGIANWAALAGASADQAAHSMLNLGQALGNGYVQRMDWKSITNAQMDNQAVKEELLKTALAYGTVVEAEEGYITTTTDAQGKTSDALTMQQLFNDGLRYRWMTSEVLIDTLKKFSNEEEEIGKKAIQAATEVGTFSKMMDTLKEAMGSGWAMTWKLIFGDYEESKALWTDWSKKISAVIDAQTDARNKLVSDWKVLGGRKAVIEGLSNVWQALLNVVIPVKEAFREIFPPLTGWQLTDLSAKFRTFTEYLILTDEEMALWKQQAKGFFSVFDLIGQAISAVVRTFAPLLKLLRLDIHFDLFRNGLMGQAISDFAAAAKESDMFYNALQRLLTPLKTFKAYLADLIEKFEEFTGLDLHMPTLEEFKNFLENTKDRFKPFTDAMGKVAEYMRNFFASLINSDRLRSIGDHLKEFGKSLGEFLVSVGGNVLKSLANLAKSIGAFFSKRGPMDFNSGFDLMNFGMLASIAASIKKAVDMLENPVESFKTVFSSLKGFLEIPKSIGEKLGKFIDSITGPLKTLQQSLRADILIKIALALIIMSGALLMLSSIPSEKLTVASVGMLVMMQGLSKVFKEFDELSKESKTSKLTGLMASVLMLSVALVIISKAIKTLGGLSIDQMINGAIAVAALTAIITQLDKLNGNSGKLDATGILAVAVAVRIVAKAIETLGALDDDQAIRGVAAVGVLMAFMYALGKNSTDGFNGKGLIAMAASMLILKRVVAAFGEMDNISLVRGVAATAALMGMITVMLKFSEVSIPMGTLLGIGVAIFILKEAALDFAALDPDQMLTGVTAVSLLMGGMLLLSQYGGKNFSAVPILVAAAAMLVLQKAAAAFGGMDIPSLAKGLIAIGASLAAFVFALNNMEGTIGGAAALVVAAAAFRVLLPVIQTLGAMPAVQIFQAFASLAMAFLIFGVAAEALQGAIGPMLGISAAIAVLGAGVALLGVGLLAAGAGLTSFGVGLTALIGSIVASIGELIVGIIGIIPIAVVALIKALQSVTAVFFEFGGVFIDAITEFGIIVLEAIRKLIPELGTVVIELLTFLLDILTVNMPILTEKIVVLIIELIDGVAMAIYNNTDRLIGACRHVAGAVIDFLLAALQEILSGIPGVGGKINTEIGKIRDAVREHMNADTGAQDGAEYTRGMADGASSTSGLLQSTGGSLGQTLKDGATGALSSLSPEVQGLLTSQLSGGIWGAQPGAEADAAGLGDGVMSSLLTGLSGSEDIGSYIAEGLGNGLTDNAGIPQEAAELLGSGTLDGLNGILEVNSPSRKTWETGMNLDQGLANGVTENQGLITTALSGLGGLFDNILSALTPKFSNAGTNSGSAFGRGVASGVGASRSAGTTLVTTASSALSTSVARFRQNGILGGSSYASGVRSKEGEARSAGVRVSANAVTGLGTAKTSFISVGMTSGSSYTSGVSSRQGAARSAGSNIGNSALSGLRSVGGWYGVGEDSSGGYLDGLMSKASSIARGAARIVSDAISAARNAIDSHSPSRKWMELGVDSDDGYIMGAESKAEAINRTMAKIAVGAMGAFYEGISRANTLATSDLLVTPTISPVFDTSSIYGDMDYLSGIFSGTGSVLGNISTEIDGHVAELNQLIANTDKIITVLQGARPITIDGATVIGWVDRELGALG